MGGLSQKMVCLRSVPVLIGLVLLMSCAQSSEQAEQSAPEAPAMAMLVTPLFGPHYGNEGRFPLRVELVAHRPFKGRLVVRHGAMLTQQDRYPVHIGKGRFRYEMMTYAGRNPMENVHVELYRDHSRFALIHQAITGEHNARLVGVFMERPWIFAPEIESGLYLPLKADQAPEDPLMYDALEMVMLSAGSARAFSQPQWEALRDWVHGGGRLLIGADHAEDLGATEPLNRYFGIGSGRDLGRSSLLPEIKAWHKKQDEALEEEIAGKTYKPLNLQLKKDDYDVMWTNMVAYEEAYTLPLFALQRNGYTGDGWVTDTPCGLGVVTLAAMDPAKLLNGDLAGAAEWLEHQLFGEPSSQDRLVAYKYGGYYYGDDWRVCLKDWLALEDISSGLIFLFLIAFIVLAGPLERRFLKRRGWLHWSWLTSAVLVFLFCYLADYISYATRGTQSRRAGLTVHDYTASRKGRWSHFECFASANSRTCTIEHDPDDLLAVPPASNRQDATPLRRDRQEHISRLRPPVWTRTMLTSQGMLDKEGPFTPELTLTSNGILHGRVVQRDDRFAFTAVYIRYEDILLPLIIQRGDTWAPAPLAQSKSFKTVIRDCSYKWDYKFWLPCDLLNDRQTSSTFGRFTHRNLCTPPEKLLFSVACQHRRNAQLNHWRTLFAGALLPTPLIQDDQAMILAFATCAPEHFRINLDRAVVKQMHIVRQMFTLQRKKEETVQ